MTPSNLIPPKEYTAYWISNGVRDSVGYFFFAANRWFDYYAKIDTVTAYRELTEQERQNFDNRQRTNIANDKRYNNQQQPTLF